MEDTPSEDFTSDSSEDDPFVSSIDDLYQEDDLALMIGKDIEPDEQIFGEETEIQMEKKLVYVPRKFGRELDRILRKKIVVVKSLYYLILSDAQYFL